MKSKTYTITIDEDFPIPEKRALANSRLEHPLPRILDRLEVGESFIYPAATCEKFNGLRANAYAYGKLTGKKFATRAVRDLDGVERLRFWRKS